MINDGKTDLYVVAVAAVIMKENQILMMKRSKEKKAGPGIWETLSGRVEGKEDPYDAIVREIKEEVNVYVEVEKRPIDLYMTSRLKKPMLLIVYKAKYISGEVELSDEHSEFKWASREEFAEASPLTRLTKSISKAFESELEKA